MKRFVRCFVVKLLTYANGEAPTSYSGVDEIVRQAEMKDFRIVDTMAIAIDSPLFRK